MWTDEEATTSLKLVQDRGTKHIILMVSSKKLPLVYKELPPFLLCTMAFSKNKFVLFAPKLCAKQRWC